LFLSTFSPLKNGVAYHRGAELNFIRALRPVLFEMIFFSMAALPMPISISISKIAGSALALHPQRNTHRV
jgi:hypothetical protein